MRTHLHQRAIAVAHLVAAKAGIPTIPCYDVDGQLLFGFARDLKLNLRKPPGAAPSSSAGPAVQPSR